MDVFDLLEKTEVSPEILAISQRINSLLRIDSDPLTQDESIRFEREIYAAIKGSGSLLKLSDDLPEKKSVGLHENLSNRMNTAKGVLLWSQLERTIGEVKYDSFGSKFLPKFPSVRAFNKAAFQKLCQRVKSRFELSEEELSRLKQEVDFLTSNLKIKNLIIEFIVKKLSLGISHCEIFKSLTGCSALDHEKIDITLTDATIFFTFDFEDNGLDPSLQYSLSDQENLKSLLDELDMFSNTERTDFPAVGKWSALKVEEEFLTQLREFIVSSQEGDVSPDVLAKTIFTMIYLLPRKNAESFFVHDAYGHSWQESICEFEHLYQLIDTLDQPLVEREFQELRDFFVAEDSNVAESISFYKRYYSRKISVAINAILAEYTADAMEFHLQQKLLQDGETIPTSSKMRDFSLFLDLSLNDTFKHLGSIKRAVTKEFSRQSKDCLREGLLRSGLTASNVDKLLKEIQNEFDIQVSIFFESKDSQVLNPVEQLVYSQLLRLYVYIDSIAKKFEPSVLQQLLLILTTHFQANPEYNFWILDQIAEEFDFCD